jgi:flagellar hook-associated protein 1 FlgK
MAQLISDILRNAQALGYHGRAVETAGHNLANQNDPSYARQRLALKDALSIDRGFAGVEPGGVTTFGREHARSMILDRQITAGSGDVAYAQAQRDVRNDLQVALGEQIDRQSSTTSLDTNPESDTVEGSLSKAIDEFFNAFQELSATPTDSAQKEVLYQKAGMLVTRFNLVDERIEQVRSNLKENISDEVAKVDGLVAEIAELNDRIQKLEYKQRGLAVDLRDQRQQAIEELGGLVSIEIQYLNNQQVGVTAKTDGGDIVLVDLDGVAGDFANEEDGTLSFDPTRGSIAGLQDAETAIDKLKNENIDPLAAQLVTAVNLAYNSGGDPAGNFFIPDSPSAASITLAAELAPSNIKVSETVFPGANDIAQGIALLAQKEFSVDGGDTIDGTFIEFISTTAARVGQDLRTAEADLEMYSLAELGIIQQREELGSVNMDEEVTDLLRYQRAFQATSKVISTLDQLLETVVTGLIR